jgi:mRNA-degrading endonuclease RelE of RelBE toxin-antitoxin system
VKSFRSWEFKALYAKLPESVQKQATSAYSLFEDNPNHPSLHFKPVSDDEPPLYSVRIGIGYRALGLRIEDDLVIWIWIGSNAAYDKLLNKNR